MLSYRLSLYTRVRKPNEKKTTHKPIHIDTGPCWNDTMPKEKLFGAHIIENTYARTIYFLLYIKYVRAYVLTYQTLTQNGKAEKQLNNVFSTTYSEHIVSH